MARWQALPDGLDARMVEFVVHMRRSVDRSGLSLTALAERTGYSRTSWERFLDGRLLAPRRATDALAEATGTSPVHLTTLWELAEQSWNPGSPDDRATTQLRVHPAALPVREVGGPTEGNSWGLAGYRGPSRTRGPAEGKGASGEGSSTAAGDRGSAGGGSSVEVGGKGLAGARSSVADVGNGSAGARSSVADVGKGSARAANSTSGAGRGPADAGIGKPVSTASPSEGFGASASTPADTSARPETRVRSAPRWLTFAAAALGVVALALAAFLLTETGPDSTPVAANSPSPSPSPRVTLPPGVKCNGPTCTGKDAETMGCADDLVTTTESATVAGTLVQVRYSKVCAAAWGRIVQAGSGDVVQVTVGQARQRGEVTTGGNTIAYTPMVAVRTATEAQACVVLASGRRGCTG
ncbi:DUF2690 domain-containing protein [Streptomyces sp. 4F14]|uniref:helix-turn-helix domain-containing protein n=1 Tax=Streptomyces sp. 4F14 TaxID=3394380 RepID=UPI003A8AB5B4